MSLRRLCLIGAALALFASGCGPKAAVAVKDEPKVPAKKAAAEKPSAPPAPALLAAKPPEKAASQEGAVKPAPPVVKAPVAEPPKAEPVKPVPPPPPKPVDPLEAASKALDEGRYALALEMIGKLGGEPAAPVEKEKVKPLLPLLERIVSAKEGGPGAVRLFVTWSHLSGMAQRGAEVLKERQEKHGQEAEVEGALGWLYAELGETELALERFSALKDTPLESLYAPLQARLLLQKGDFPGASAALLKAPKASPEARMVAARLEQAEGRVSSAENIYLSLLKDKPGDFTALINYGALKLGQGDLAKAVELFEKAALSAPLRPEPFNNLGLAKRTAGNHKEALLAYKKALELAPAYAPALKNMGILQEKYLGQPKEAVKYYKSYLEVAPEDKDAARWLKNAERQAAAQGEAPK